MVEGSPSSVDVTGEALATPRAAQAAPLLALHSDPSSLAGRPVHGAGGDRRLLHLFASMRGALSSLA